MGFKYTIDETLMDNIDSEEKAYWLGFFYADAYNNEKRGRIVIELAEKDKEHLFKCANFFGKPRQPFLQIKNSSSKTKKATNAYRLELNSFYLSRKLSLLGCHQKKSLNLIFPDYLDDKLIRHFIRGYFDGDGSIFVHQGALYITIMSTIDFCRQLQTILLRQKVNCQLYQAKRLNNQITKLDCGGNQQIFKFCEWIYSDATIYLDRKYNVYKNYYDEYRVRQQEKKEQKQLIKNKLIKEVNELLVTGKYSQHEIARKLNTHQIYVSKISRGIF